MTSTATPEALYMATDNDADAMYAADLVAALAASIANMTTSMVAESSTQNSVRRRVSSRSHSRVMDVPNSSGVVAIQILDALNAAYMPLIIYLGIVGNILSLVTFLFTKLKNRTSSLYMGALAVSDSGFLIVLSFAWLSERGMNVYQHGICLFTVFFSSTFACWSVWLTVSFTAERFVAVRYPLWKLQTSSPSRRPRLVIGVTALFSVALNAPLLFFVHVNDGEFADCSLHPEYESTLYYLNILDTVLTFILPFLLITVMNSMIARAVYLFYARYKKQSCVAGCHQEEREPRGFSPTTRDVQVVSSDGPATASSGGGTAHATQISVTRMLLLVSTVFILLNLPSYVMRIYVFLLSLGHSRSKDPDVNSLPYVLQRYFMLLYYTNFSINFVLYNASSRMFRVTLSDYIQGRWLALCESMAGVRSNVGHSSASQNDDIII